MDQNLTRMKPIWFFVGVILLIIGAITLSAGIYYLFIPEHHHTELPGLHINIWWGLVLMAAGGIMAYVNRKPVDL